MKELNIALEPEMLFSVSGTHLYMQNLFHASK